MINGGTKMKANNEYSKLQHSVAYQMIRNSESEMEYIRKQFEGYCGNNQYKGALLNGYNKMYQLNFRGLQDYFDNRLPQKYFVEFFNQYI